MNPEVIDPAFNAPTVAIPVPPAMGAKASVNCVPDWYILEPYIIPLELISPEAVIVVETARLPVIVTFVPWTFITSVGGEVAADGTAKTILPIIPSTFDVIISLYIFAAVPPFCSIWVLSPSEANSDV